MAQPPVIKIGPPPASGGKANQFDKFIAQHKGMAKYKTAIQQWAGEYGVPALWVAAAIWKESKGQNVPWNPTVQGAGLAQLNIDPNNNSHAPAAAQAVLGRAPTYKDAMDPNTAIQILAYSMTGAASLDQWYQQTWNPGFKPNTGNVLPSTYLKGYNVSVTGHTPQQKAAGSAATAQAKAQNLPLLQGQARQFLDPIYLAYTGKRATPSEINNYINFPVSQYQIETQLSNPKTNPSIYKSPVWLTHSGTYDAYFKSIYGASTNAPKSAILYGIVHNLDQAAFEDLAKTGKLPGAPDYTTSEQYKGNFADATQVYARIYGTPDDVGNTFLKSAVLGGWNQSQIENYLRSQPEYKSSPEYKQRSLDLASQMGLIQGTGGAQTALQAATPPPPPQPSLQSAEQQMQQAAA